MVTMFAMYIEGKFKKSYDLLYLGTVIVDCTGIAYTYDVFKLFAGN